MSGDIQTRERLGGLLKFYHGEAHEFFDHTGTMLEEKAILTLLRQRLANYKVPKKVTLLSALPRNATGKVLKTELRLQA